MSYQLWRRTLFARAATRYFALVTLVTIVIVALFYFFWRLTLLKVEQTVQWDIAQEVVARIEQHPEFQNSDLAARKLLILKEFYYLAQVNPRVEPYILGPAGEVLLSLYSDWSVQPVPIEPIVKFLSHQGMPEDLFYGENPLHDQHEPVLFSAAELRLGEEHAFVYIVTSGRRYWMAFQQFADFTAVLGTAVLFLIVGAASMTIGYLVFLQLSKSARKIIDATAVFATGDFSGRISLPEGDELSLVAETMNTMAAQIAESLAMKERNDALRRELISNISHDLRHPVAVMQTALESSISRLEALSREELAGTLGRGLASCRNLRTQLDELFSLAQLNSTDYQLSKEEFCVEELCEEVLSSYSEAARAADIELRLEYPDAVPQARADISLYGRVLQNLLSNAIRHTKSGGSIDLRITVKSESRLLISVADTGSGIAEEQIPLIFERYFTSRGEGDSSGTGLGLAITKRILELHDCAIWVQSTLGVGSTFFFEIPRA